MNGHTNHTPCGGDPEAAIIALERRALERWNQGDPDGFLELTSGDVVYFDPALGRKLIGKKALGEYYGTVRGKIRIGLSPGRTIEAVRRGRIFASPGFGMQIARHGAWKKESVNGSHNAGTWIGPYCTCACSREA